ncbi:hypothetical protein E5C31_00135 [Providencia rettgeri]|nr:hypothetical protein [Providencia rettgeri]
MINLISSLLASVSSLFAVFFLFSFAYLKYKGAYFIFFNKIWSYFHREEFYDSFLDSERKNCLDLERFKAMYSINSVSCPRDASRAVKWSRVLSIPLRNMGKAGRWVKWDVYKVRKPSVDRVILTILGFAFLLVLSTPFAILTFNSEAIIKFDESGALAWQGKQGLRSFMKDGDERWSFDLSLCSSGISSEIKSISLNDLKSVCEAVESGSYFSQLDSTVTLQRYFAGPFLIYFLFFIMLVFKELLSLQAAVTLYREVPAAYRLE